jgi:hypothetical protein
MEGFELAWVIILLINHEVTSGGVDVTGGTNSFGRTHLLHNILPLLRECLIDKVVLIWDEDESSNPSQLNIGDIYWFLRLAQPQSHLSEPRLNRE